MSLGWAIFGLLCSLVLVTAAETSRDPSSAILGKQNEDLTVFIGGSQTPNTGPGGNKLSTYNVNEEEWSSFNWGCDGTVRLIKVIDESVYLAGDFTACDNQKFGPMVRYHIPSGEFYSVLPDGATWGPAWDSIDNAWSDPITVRDWQLYKGRMYIVGLFSINFDDGTKAASVASFDLESGAWKIYGEGLNARVNGVWVQDERTILFVGRFTRSGYGESFVDTYFESPGFAVWHEDHPIYGTGYMSYTIPISENNFAPGWTLDGEVYGVWRGLLQIQPNGERLNAPFFTPEPERLTIILVGNFTGGIIYQQDSLPWHMPDGGVYGGPILRLAPFLEEDAFFFGGSFTHAGDANQSLATSLSSIVRWNFQHYVPRGGNSIPQPAWDDLLGGVTGGAVYGLAVERTLGVVTIAGSFTGPFERVALFDLVRYAYRPIGVGNEFSADLYAVAITDSQLSTNVWSGIWKSNRFVGNLYSCVVANAWYAGHGFAAFEGSISLDGQSVYGTFVTAGNSEAPNRGTFGLALSADKLSFKGWYMYDGDGTTYDWEGTRLTFSQPDLYLECLAVDPSEGGTLASQWIDDVLTLDMCLVALDTATGSSTLNAGTYYTGIVGSWGKTVQAQYFNSRGYGMSLFRQSNQNQMVEVWFSGDVSDISATSDCSAGIVCGYRVYTRNEAATLTDEACQQSSDFDLWTGTWTGCFGKGDFHLRPTGSGFVHGSNSFMILEGILATPARLSGNFVTAGDHVSIGRLAGTFDFSLDVGQPWEGRSFRGSITFGTSTSGEPLERPISISCQSQRVSKAFPLIEKTFARSPSAGASVEGKWQSESGEILDVCVAEPTDDNDHTIFASSSLDVFYQGVALSFSSSAIEFFQSFADPAQNGRDTAAVSRYPKEWRNNGVGLFRRVKKDTLEVTWMTANISPAGIAFHPADCSPFTCQLNDNGPNNSLYTYVGPTTTEACTKLSKYAYSESRPTLLRK